MSFACLADVESPPALLPHPLSDADGVEDLEPRSLLRLALARFSPGIAVVTSFQAEGLVLLDMAWRIDPAVRVITLDTGRLPQETYDVIAQVRERYGVEVELYFPNARAVETLVRRGGPNLFYDSVDARLACCHVRKVEPLKRALAGLDAWITGLRRDQSPARAGIAKLETDRDHGGIVKLNPLADWTWDEVEAYVRRHDVPRHPLYARGFASIGCAPCTRPVAAGESPRAGRWWWEANGHKECGLHRIRAVAEVRA